MTIPEIFGFLITLFILGFLFLKQVWEARARRANPEEYQRKQLEKEKRLKEFMKTLNIETDDDDDEAEEDRRIKASNKAKQAQKQMQQQIQQVEKRSNSANQSQSQNLTRRLPSSPSTTFAPARVTRQSMNLINSQVRVRGTVFTATQEQESVASKLIQDQRSMRDAILLCEIIGPPKGKF
jgi:type IV secretory pathway VirB4 component